MSRSSYTSNCYRRLMMYDVMCMALVKKGCCDGDGGHKSTTIWGSIQVQLLRVEVHLWRHHIDGVIALCVRVVNNIRS